MANSTTTNVVIIPGMANTFATAMRGHLNAALAYMRAGDSDCMEQAIKELRSDLVRFEREVRLNVRA